MYIKYYIIIMLNIKLLFNNINKFLKKIKYRISNNFNIKLLLKIYNDYKKIKFDIEYLQFKKNHLSNRFFFYKKNKLNILYLIYFIKLIKENILFKKKKLKILYLELNKYILNIPNIPLEDVPIGNNNKNNRVINYWGNTKKKYSFKLLDHIKLCKFTNNLDFKQSSLLSGTSFVVMKNVIALLYRAISQFMINYHIKENNYNEIYVPYIVKVNSLYNAGQLPKFKNNIYYVHKNNDINKFKYALIPTSEVALINLFKDKIFKETELPIKLVSNTPCFRAESISYGKNNKGLIRLNQFDKVELIQIVKPNNSVLSLDELTSNAEKILQLLKIPYRKVLLSTGTMGFSSCKTYDIEFWSPVNKKFLEVSSCSNTSDFQSRRINIKYYDVIKNKKKFVHIINGSGLAVGRTLIAILDNYQVENRVIKIPKVLIKYMNGIKYINFNK